MNKRAMKMMRKPIALVCMSIAAFSTAPAQAQSDTEVRLPVFGKNGDAGDDLRCAPNTFITGFRGAAGSNLDRLQVSCSPIQADGRAGRPNWTSAMRGGYGGADATSDCDRAGTYVTGVGLRQTDDARQIEYIRGNCSRPDGLTGQAGIYGQHVNGGIGSYGSEFGQFSKLACPGGMAATGLTVRYGKHINGVGLICNFVVRAAPPASPPPIAAANAPARTGRVVTMGRVADDPTNLFNGTWNAKDSQGEPFVIKISAKVDGYVIAKVAYAGDPQNADSHRFVLGNGRMLPSANPPSLPWIKGSVSPPGDSRATFIMIKNGKRGSAVVNLLSQGQLIAGGGKLEDGEEYGFQATRGADTTPD